MNPFASPERIFISAHPQDMRAGIAKLSAIVAATFGHDPADGSLYVFVSRDAKQLKAIKFECNAWVMYTVKLCRGTFKWKGDKQGDGCCLCLERRELMWLLEGLEICQPKSFSPVRGHNIL